MQWIAPSEKDTANETLEKRLWAAADQFRANSGLKCNPLVFQDHLRVES
jgi:type I restriction enzyme M protein